MQRTKSTVSYSAQPGPGSHTATGPGTTGPHTTGPHTATGPKRHTAGPKSHTATGPDTTSPKRHSSTSTSTDQGENSER